MLQLLLCDDDRAAAPKLKASIEQTAQALGTPVNVFLCHAEESIPPQVLAGCDIAFLDVDLGTNSSGGLHVAGTLRQANPACVILFVTHYIEYAPEGYEVGAFRYLLKRDIPAKLPVYLAQAIEEAARRRRTVSFSCGGEVIRLELARILYIEASLRRVRVYLEHSDRPPFEFYATLGELERSLGPAGFLRIQRSYLVNMQKIRRLQNYKVLLTDGTELPASEKHFQTIKSTYLKWQGAL